ncbi:MAG: hypothetical protein ABII09_09015 [Planctomycetota bacterium]
MDINTLLALVAIIGGIAGSLVAYKIVPMTMFGSFDIEAWHDKFGKIFKILGPLAIIIGLVILLS